MGERWVVNASPVILLGKADVIHLLPQLCDELIIPKGVLAEVDSGGLADRGAQWLQNEGRAYVRALPDLDPALEAWRGGAGEGEVISWAIKNPDFVAILDDRRARSFAQGHGVRVVGSLRIIVLAKERGLIRSARSALEKLRGAGAYVTDSLIERAISLAGEDTMS